MDVVSEMCDRFIKLDVNDFIFKILRQKEFTLFILQLNTEDQLYKKHIDSEGKPLTYKRRSNGYSLFYELDRQGYKIDGTTFKAGDPYTLKDSGEFYGSFHIDFYEPYFSINANPIKEESNLFSNFGIDIIGLTDENIEKVENYLFPLLEIELAKLI